MLRIRTVLVMITFEAIGYEVIKPTGSLSMNFFLAAVMLGALYTSATCFNDVADEEIDKVNLANDVSRPLVTANVTGEQLRSLGVIALLVAAVAGVLVSPWYILLLAGGTVLNVLYNLPPFKVSHRGIFASLLLSCSYVAIPFFSGALMQGHLTSISWYVLIAMCISFIGRVLLKDFRDYEGDKKFGKLNFLVRHGPVVTCLTSGVMWLIGDIVIIATLRTTFLAFVILAQPILLAIFYGLYLLAYEKQYSQKLLEVLFVGRLGNAIALALLAALTLQAFDYSSTQKNITVVTVGLFMALTAVGLWRDSTLKDELKAKTPVRKTLSN